MVAYLLGSLNFCVAETLVVSSDRLEIHLKEKSSVFANAQNVFVKMAKQTNFRNVFPNCSSWEGFLDMHFKFMDYS